MPFPFSLLVLVLLSLQFTFSSEKEETNYILKEVEIVSNGKPVRIFTPEELKNYDGTDEELPILMGIKGVIFDVSSGKRFYGKTASYNALVGKDSTKAVAKMSLEPSDLNPDISDLNEAELKALDQTFEGTYMVKYPIVGYMDYLLEQHPEKFASLKTQKKIEL